MFKIYGMYTPMFNKVVLVAEELGADFEVIDVDLIKGETRTPEHLKRHLFGKVPVLEHNGEFIFESNAIIRYMANVSTSNLYPSDNLKKAKVDQWMDYFTIQAGKWLTTIWFENCIAPNYFDREADQKVVAEAQEYLLEVMPKIDSHLDTNKYLAGSELSLADLNAFVLMRGYKEAKLNLDDFRNFTRWFDQIDSLESVKKTWKA
ncbi:MAG: glutathione S-transferase family protein [Halobacteriovoraceae bacterium]|mgnify:CR=1 FL=1|jgi:glutathione S-transferase|nr:glutathione S-transferase family protein [Halobacteriovoraceae bacterium]MBT5093404.1 glutathione S-transferase family protein [Halobacteriovoraceae bacterium]